MATAEAEVRGDTARAGMPVVVLTSMVVGSMVGAGVFSLPSNFARATGVYGALLAWAIAGAGMLMLAFVFQILAVRKPELNAGVYSYAKAGFGEMPGFFSAFGYWASACVGNVTYWILIGSTLGLVFPALGHGDTLWAAALGVVGVWLFAWLILRGVRQAAVINNIVTVAKLVPIVVFLLCVLFLLKGDVFSANLWGGAAHSVSGLFGQVRATMLLTVFVFLGVEGASVYSRYARRRRDVGTATVLGFLSVLALFALVTILSYGTLPRSELADLRQPSMSGVLTAAAGSWGTPFISVGLVISVLGAYLAWTLMAAEVLFIAAADHDMPRFLARQNRRDAPWTALVLSSALTTVVLLVSLMSEDAFTFTLELCSALSLIPYLLAAGYALRLAATGETYEAPGSPRARHLLTAAIAVVYTAFLLWAAGLDHLLLSCIIYAPGTLLFVLTRRERGHRVFSPAELVLFLIVLAGGVAGLTGLITGRIAL